MVVINWLFWPRHARRQVSSAQFFAMLSRPSHESASRGYAANARWSIPDATRRWSRKCAEKTSRAQLDRPVRALARLDPREARAWQKFYFLLGSQDVHDAAAPRPQAWTTQCSELRLHQSWPNNCRAKPPQLPNKKRQTERLPTLTFRPRVTMTVAKRKAQSSPRAKPDPTRGVQRSSSSCWHDQNSRRRCRAREFWLRWWQR